MQTRYHLLAHYRNQSIPEEVIRSVEGLCSSNYDDLCCTHAKKIIANNELNLEANGDNAKLDISIAGGKTFAMVTFESFYKILESKNSESSRPNVYITRTHYITLINKGEWEIDQ